MLVEPGADVSLYGTTLADNPDLAGTVEVDELIRFDDGRHRTSGVLQSRVLRTAAGTLDLIFAVRELNGLPLHHVGWHLFGDVTTDIDFRLLTD